jgi:type II secretory pathway component PulF
MNTKHITLSTNEKISFVSNLNTLLSSGIPILETIDSLLQDSKGNQKKLLESMRVDLMQGQRLYAAFAKFPGIFDKVTINVIKASEEAGALDSTLKDMKDNIKKDSEFSDRVRSALIYPGFIFGVFTAVMLMILTVVIPKISTVFSQLRVVLPLPTRIMIFASNLLLKNTVIVLIVAGALITGFVFLYKTQKQLITQQFIKLPVVSKLAKNIDLTRFARSMYLLLNAGLPITTALELSGETVTNARIQRVIKECHDLVTSGERLSVGFRRNKNIIPGIVIKITEAGEKSGSLDKAMLDISEYLEYEVSGSLKAVTAMIEPIMLVGVGIMVGGMMLAIIAPIYNLIGQISPNH